MRFNPLDYPAAFMYPERNSSTIDWWGHIPFGACAIQALKPKKIVELGVFLGDSLSCFAQAAEACDLTPDITGIDTWTHMNDEGQQKPAQTEATFAYFAKRFPRVHLDRRDFNVAVLDTPNDSIDLLHIDGDHTFAAVQNDFTKWLPKLAPNGVILFHDIAIGTNKHNYNEYYGVDRFWRENLRPNYPFFEFYHSWGLGVLAPKGIPSGLATLFAAVGTDDEAPIQTFFQLMGTRNFVSMLYRARYGDHLLLDGISNPCLVSDPSALQQGTIYSATALHG